MKEENFMISTINIDGVEIKTEISSREIAKLSNKEHKHVLRDIKILIEALKTGATQNKISIEKQEEINRLKFEPSYETQQELGKSKTGPSSETQQTRDIFEINGFEFKKSTYLTSQNKKQVEIILNKQAAILLATGYDHNLRSTIITRINELEKQLFEKANPYLNLSKLDWIKVAMEGEKKLMAANYTIYQQNQKIEADKPKVELAEHVEVSDCSMIVEDVAKCLYDKHKIEMGKNRLMDWYREKGWLTERNIPTQKSIEAELFERKPIWNEKLQKYIPTSFVTSKGLVKTLNMLSYEMKTYHRLMDGL